MMPKPRSAKQIRELVEDLLKRHGVAQKIPVPIEEIARAEGAELRYMPYDGDLSGMVYRDDDRTVIGVNSLHHPNRERFTIAHELGHMLMHKGKEVFVDRKFRINFRDGASAEGIEPEEIDANRFAAEILIPYDMIVEDLKGQQLDAVDEEEIAKLARKYRVSTQTMTYRIFNL